MVQQQIRIAAGLLIAVALMTPLGLRGQDTKKSGPDYRQYFTKPGTPAELWHAVEFEIELGARLGPCGGSSPRASREKSVQRRMGQDPRQRKVGDDRFSALPQYPRVGVGNRPQSERARGRKKPRPQMLRRGKTWRI